MSEIWDWIQANGAIVGLLAIVVSVVLHALKTRADRRVLARYVSQLQVVSVVVNRGANRGDIELRYGGWLLDGVWRHRVCVKNVGTKDLKDADIKIPLTVEFDEVVQIVTSSVDFSYGGLASPAVQQENNKFVFPIVLLQPGEQVEATFLVSSDEPPFVSLRATDFRVIDGDLSDAASVTAKWILLSAIGLICDWLWIFPWARSSAEPWKTMIGLLAVVFLVPLILSSTALILAGPSSAIRFIARGIRRAHPGSH